MAFLERLGETLRGGLKDQSGNVAMMFGLSLFGMVTVAGVAVDYSSASGARTSLAAAADAAALAGATTKGTAAQRQAVALATFETNLQRAGLDGTFTPTFTPIEEGGRIVGFTVGVSGSVRSRFGGFTGKPTVDIDLLAEARSGGSGPVDIALVLDTTASMEGSRLAGLKSAVSQLLDSISATDLAAGSIRVGIVPFAQYVNVGMSYRNAPWIDVPSDYQVPVTNTCRLVPDQTATNCRDEYRPPVPAYTCYVDGSPRTCPGRDGYTERVCDWVNTGTQTNVCGPTGGNWVRWNGCVGARPYPLNIQDGSYSTRIPGVMDVTCASPLQTLTSDISSVRATVNGLTASGDTFLPSGLVWGWRMLSAADPFTPGLNAGQVTKKVMVLVTDGRNTRSVETPLHTGYNAAASDTLTRETCQNIAADNATGARIYTIAFEMDGLDAKAILQDCASRTGGAFYDANNSGALTIALQQVLQAALRVSLTR